MTKPFLTSPSPSVPGECCLVCRSTKASVASRSGVAGQAAASRTDTSQYQSPSDYLVAAWPSTSCSSCTRKKMRPTLLCNGESVACAGSFDPRMAFGQSVAQPEPRTPCAPNSNRCSKMLKFHEFPLTIQHRCWAEGLNPFGTWRASPEVVRFHG